MANKTVLSSSVIIRDEQPVDAEAIRAVVRAAFQGHPYSSGTEAAIVDALRAADAMIVSLVAEENGIVVGHVAFSEVTISGIFRGWYGLGPLAVLPAFQGRGTGTALVDRGLQLLCEEGAAGCVLLGDPEYYSRFGFRALPELRLEDVPPEYFLALPLEEVVPRGNVAFHPAFQATD